MSSRQGVGVDARSPDSAAATLPARYLTKNLTTPRFRPFLSAGGEQKGPLCGPFLCGASRARTGDLLGAIYPKSFATFPHRSPSVSNRPDSRRGGAPSFAAIRRRYLTKT